MGKKKVLILATNYGTWGEELQAPWDIIKKAGHEVTLATWFGKKPLPLVISCDPKFHDPVINADTNPPDVCKRIKELTDGNEWAHPLKFKDAKMADYDAVVLTGGLGAMIDMCNNWGVHKLILDAVHSNKLVGALCYAVSALVFCRDPQNGHKSVIYGKKVTAHPASWDFYGPDWDFTYDLYGATPDNKGTDVHTPGFLWPVEHLVRDAVGPNGVCVANYKANRIYPEVAFDWPFVTGTSVESSIAYGEKIVEVLATLK
ncbi:MAG: type 1 glutamine amidotransferase domain-containing protein [Candidatus Omnitrophota bacterium]|jgi:putative intracellular protease/amidase